VRQNHHLQKLYDISPLVHPGLAVWPGDVPFSTRRQSQIAAGDTVNLGSIATTAHLGAHADAPFHSEGSGATIEQLELEAFLGPCRVVAVPPVALVGVEHVGAANLAASRLLLRTGSAPDRTRFPNRCSAIAPALAEALGRAGARLVGIDTPSVDPIDSKTLETHHVLNRYGVRYLEGLLLDDVPEGAYELIALPLRLGGLDASPVRAVLRELPPATR
jgi:arylformamidase